MSPPPKFICWNPNTQCDGIRRWGLWGWLGHEVGAFMNGLSALIKQTPRSSLAPSTCEDTERTLQPGKRALTRPCRHPDLRLPASRAVNNKLLLFLSHPICGILLEQPIQTQTDVKMFRLTHQPVSQVFPTKALTWAQQTCLCQMFSHLRSSSTLYSRGVCGPETFFLPLQKTRALV